MVSIDQYYLLGATPAPFLGLQCFQQKIQNVKMRSMQLGVYQFDPKYKRSSSYIIIIRYCRNIYIYISYMNHKNNLLPDLLSLVVGLRGGKRPVALVVTFD